MKIKGNVLLSRVAFVKENFSEESWREVRASLPDEDRTSLDYLAAAGWYPFEMAQRLEQAIQRIVGKGDPRIFEKMGATSAQKNLTGAHRHFLEVGNPHAFLAKAPQIYRFYYDKGRREYEQTGPTSATLTTYDSDVHSTADCLTVIGWHKHALGMCGAKDVHMIEEECIARGGAVCRYQVSWKM